MLTGVHATPEEENNGGNNSDSVEGGDEVVSGDNETCIDSTTVYMYFAKL